MVAPAFLNCLAASSLLISSFVDPMPSTIPEVRGLNVDAQTRCLHYHSPLDIIAIKMKCCATYFACKDCHEALADHPIELWPSSEWETPAILCGSCRAELSIANYLKSNSRCPHCQAAFNPRCSKHHHVYFAVSPDRGA